MILSEENAKNRKATPFQRPAGRLKGCRFSRTWNTRYMDALSRLTTILRVARMIVAAAQARPSWVSH